MSKSAYAALSSVGDARIAFFFRLASANLSCAIWACYFAAVPKPTTVYECIAGSLDDDMKPFVNDFKINLFEIAFLTDAQVSMFQSDFRIVADYFVQARKNKNYKPTDTQMKHVKEVLQLMSVLTHDNRFEEAADAVVEGDGPKNMCDVLDKVEQRGKKIGEEIGKEIGLKIGEMKKAREAAAKMKARGFSNQDISDIVGMEIKTVDSWFSGTPLH